MKPVRQRSREKGSAMVEFSLAIITILIVLFGIIDVGRALYAYDWVSDAARRGTRYAMVRGSECSGLGADCPATAEDIETYVKSLGTGIDTSQVTVTSQCFATSSIDPSPPCAAPAWVKVTVTYHFHLVSPLLPIDPWNMHSASERIVQQ